MPNSYYFMTKTVPVLFIYTKLEDFSIFINDTIPHALQRFTRPHYWENWWSTIRDWRRKQKSKMAKALHFIPIPTSYMELPEMCDILLKHFIVHIMIIIQLWFSVYFYWFSELALVDLRSMSCYPTLHPRKSNITAKLIWRDFIKCLMSKILKMQIQITNYTPFILIMHYNGDNSYSGLRSIICYRSQHWFIFLYPNMSSIVSC